MSNSNSIDRLTKYGWLLHAVGGSVAAAMLLLFYYLIWTPLCERMADNGRRNAELQEVIASFPELRRQQSELREELSVRSNDLAELIKRLPEDANESEFLTLINQLAKQQGVAIRQYQPGSANQRGAYSQMTIRLSCDANYQSLCGFVEQLAELPRLCSVSTMAIRTSGEESSYPVDITLLIYFDLDPSIGVDGQEA